MNNSPIERECWLPLFGLPLVVRTNSHQLASLMEAEHPLGYWSNLPPDEIEPIAPLQIDLLVGSTEDFNNGMQIFRHRQIALAGDGPRLLMAQIDRGYGLACMPTQPLAAMVSVIWELGLLLAQARSRLPVQAAALERDGHVVLLIGADLLALIESCVARGLRLLARQIVHIGSPGSQRIWGDGSGRDLLYGVGPATACLVEHGAGQASQIAPLPTTAVDGLESATSIIRSAYWLRAGSDVAMAAALVEHVA
ncbi:MAG: hypothetical protein HGA65_03610 [Oscillochloris sp.]|nr:hypothetical protein [Oscillochloris sp.]